MVQPSCFIHQPSIHIDFSPYTFPIISPSMKTPFQNWSAYHCSNTVSKPLPDDSSLRSESESHSWIAEIHIPESPVLHRWTLPYLEISSTPDSIGINVPPVSETNVPPSAERNVPLVSDWNVPPSAEWNVPLKKSDVRSLFLETKVYLCSRSNSKARWLWQTRKRQWQIWDY